MIKEKYLSLIAIPLMILAKDILGQNKAASIPITFKKENVKKSISYIGSIRFPSSLKNIPLTKCPLPRVYHQGNLITLLKNYDNDQVPFFSYTCCYDFHISTFDIVIALIATPENNTIENLKVPLGCNYIHYELKREMAPSSKEECFWNIKETRGVGPFTIPSSAVLIVEDADLIKGIKKEINWNSNGFSVLLPTIIYLDVEKELFEYVHNIALFASLDTDGFHKKEEWVILQLPKNQIFKTRIS